MPTTPTNATTAAINFGRINFPPLADGASRVPGGRRLQPRDAPSSAPLVSTPVEERKRRLGLRPKLFLKASNQLATSGHELSSYLFSIYACHETDLRRSAVGSRRTAPGAAREKQLRTDRTVSRIFQR